MLICRDIAATREAVARFHAAGETVGLVTTMGALHAGHRALVDAAREVYDRVVTTIFVNPTQFGNPRDLETYPRDEAGDLAVFEAAGVDAVFLPDVAEIYPPGDETVVETMRLSSLFHGAIRVGHFRGVATVVAKLFNIVGADGAFFGQKDYQQLAVIRAMVRDLHMPVAIHGVPTVRAPDGLALSSRNSRLTPEDRAAAPVLHRALTAAAGAATVAEMNRLIRETLATEPRARLVGLDIVDVARFLPAEGRIDAPVGIMLSAEFGPPAAAVLLIDQLEIDPGIPARA